MRYNLGNALEIAAAYGYLTRLSDMKATVNIQKLNPKRSLSQNNYLYLLLGAFGAHLGYSTEESKYLYKRLPGNKTIYEYTKDVGGKPMTFMRSSADLDKEEMARTIDTLREWSSKMGYPLPEATDREWLDRLSNFIEENERFM